MSKTIKGTIIKGWLARNLGGKLRLFSCKPRKWEALDHSYFTWDDCGGETLELPDGLFPDFDPEETKQVTISIEIDDESED